MEDGRRQTGKQTDEETRDKETDENIDREKRERKNGIDSYINNRILMKSLGGIIIINFDNMNKQAANE